MTIKLTKKNSSKLTFAVLKKAILLLLNITLPTLIFAQTNQTAQNRLLVIRNVTLIDMRSEQPQPNMTVVVSGNRISKIGRNIKIPKNAAVLDASGKFLIPGLWDMHVHVDDAGDWLFPLFLANGVTGVRDLGSHLRQIEIWREMRGRNALMPRIFAAGPLVSGKVGDADPRMILVGERDEAVEAVDDLAAQKVDFIKVHDWMTPEAYRGLVEAAKKRKLPVVGHVPVLLTGAEVSNAGQRSVEHYGNVWGGLFVDSSTKEAELRGEMRKLAALVAPEFNPPKMFAAQGEDWEKRLADSFDREKAANLARVFKRNGTWFVPTIQNAGYSELFIAEAMIGRDSRLKYFPLATQKMIEELVNANNAGRTSRTKIAGKQLLFKRQLELVRIMRDNGVGLLAGTDAIPFPPAFPGFDLHDELQRFVDAGLSPLEALRTATVNPAKFFSMTDSLGTIETGKLADLVLLDSNPLLDISNTKKINAVVANGRYLSKKILDKMLTEVEAAAKKK